MACLLTQTRRGRRFAWYKTLFPWMGQHVHVHHKFYPSCIPLGFPTINYDITKRGTVRLKWLAYCLKPGGGRFAGFLSGSTLSFYGKVLTRNSNGTNFHCSLVRGFLIKFFGSGSWPWQVFKLKAPSYLEHNFITIIFFLIILVRIWNLL